MLNKDLAVIRTSSNLGSSLILTLTPWAVLTSVFKVSKSFSKLGIYFISQVIVPVSGSTSDTVDLILSL